MRVHWRAIIFWVTRQISRIDAATGVELGQIDVYLLVEPDLGADDTWAKPGTANDPVGRCLRGRRQ
jgi:hypothetical protein